MPTPKQQIQTTIQLKNLVIKQDELKQLDCPSLKTEAKSLKKEYFNLRLGLITGQVKDTSQFKKLRRQVARALTLEQQKRRAENNQKSKA